jgi:Uma2 family endonuclease
MSSPPIAETAPVWAYPPNPAPRGLPAGGSSPPTAAAVWLRAGQVPLERILTVPAPGTATIDDAIHSRQRLHLNCELVDGILVAKPMGYFESKVALALAFFFHQYLDGNPIGEVAGEDGPCETLPDHVRKPDVSFTSFERIKSQSKPTRKALPFAPDLAVEILSPSNTAAEMEKKLKEYFAAGAHLVWHIEPELQTARVYTAPEQWEDVPAAGALRGGDVLPGFELPLAKLFAKAGPRLEE